MGLKVNEVFGPTIQGEGPSAGRHCLFVRLADCNLHCWWCDTPYTWAFTENKAAQHKSGKVHDKAEEIHYLADVEIFQQLRQLWDITNTPTTIVISGGEPMLQQKELDGLVRLLYANGNRIEIETAGTIVPTERWAELVQFNVSPKLDHSGNTIRARRNPDALWSLARHGGVFKFVVGSKDDFAEIDEIVRIAGIATYSDKIWIMPEGTTIDAIREHAQLIADEVLARGWNITLRNHVMIWGDERGK